MKQNWFLKPPPSKELVQNLSKKLGLSNDIISILINRGYNTPDKIEKFMDPQIEDMHDPFLMRDMKKTTSRIIKAIKLKEKILIYGDYDVDGTTGTTLLYTVLQKLNANVSYYIPHRLKDGYGLTETGIKYILQSYVNLIITVDCGIGATDSVKELNKQGIDVIITDHHEPGEEVPAAFAILNPKIDNYPFKKLVGCGIALKLAQAIFSELKIPERKVLFHLDLAALATVCDVAPIIEENRIITKFGAKMIQYTKKEGLKTLLEVSGVKDKEINTYDIGFVLGPRINALGRLDEAGDVVKMLVTEDGEEADVIAKRLDIQNKSRIEIQKRIVGQAREIVKNMNLENIKGIVLASPEWHAGVVGIAASKIAEEFYRPTILIALDKDTGKGSGRSIPEFNLYDSIKKCEGYLEKFGGHKQAVGLVIKRENIKKFKDWFNKIAQVSLKQEQLIPKFSIDKEISLESIDKRLLDDISKFAPFGLGNPRPIFLSKNLEIVGYPNILKNKHLKFKVREDNNVLTAIAFNCNNLDVSRMDRVDIIYQIDESEYLGVREILLKIKDIEVIKT